MTRCTLITAVLFGLASFQPNHGRAEAQQLDPTNTYAFVVGVLNWEAGNLTTYSTKQRQDRELTRTLKEMGVPADNITMLLDKDATLANIQKSFTELCAKSKDDSTLIVYYAGHGICWQSQGVFANYDIDTQDPQKCTWWHKDLRKTIVDKFKGRRVLLLADCCFSGILDQIATELEAAEKKVAVLTSAAPSVASTGNWTYTMSLIDSLRGQPLADANEDGFVSIGEAGREIKQAMNHHEKQAHGFSLHGFKDDFRLVRTAKRSKEERAQDEAIKPFRLGQFVQLQAKNGWRTARIVGVAPPEESAKGSGKTQLRVEIQNYNTREVSIVPKASVRSFDANFVKRFELPKPLLGKAGETKATMDGKYSNLLKKIRVDRDLESYNATHDWGYYTGTTYAGHSDLPIGYWVYVYPNWYIWGKSKDAAKPKAAVQIKQPAVARIKVLGGLEDDAVDHVPVKPNGIVIHGARQRKLRPWGPEQATGPPNTQRAGDSSSAWASQTADGEDGWLQLTYNERFTISEIVVHENFNPGAVFKATSVADDRTETRIWIGKDPVEPSESWGVAKLILKKPVKTDTIRLYLRSSDITGYNEIDAVGVVDQDKQTHWATGATASSFWGQDSAGAQRLIELEEDALLGVEEIELVDE